MIRLIIICLFSTTLCLNAYSQYSSEKNAFTVPDDEACAPYTPVITVADPTKCAGGGCTFFPDEKDLSTGRTLVSGQPIVDYQYQPGQYRMKVVIGNDPTTQIIDYFTIAIYDAAPPDFNFFICSANRVQVEILDTKYPEYSIDYNTDNAIDDLSPTGMVNPYFTYAPAQSGISQTISVRGNYPNCQTQQKPVIPGNFAPDTPFINELQVVNSTDIAMQIATTDNYYYGLEMSPNAASPMTQVQRIRNEKTIALTGLSPETNYYCYRIGVADICTSPSYTYGNLICSVDLNLSVQPDVMKLTWNTSNSGVSSFTLDKAPGSAIAIPSSTLSYNDTDLNCGTDYTYQIVSEYSNGSKSISLPYSGTAISNKVPPTIGNVTSVVGENGVELSWLVDPAVTPDVYTIYRIANNGTSSIGTTDTPSFTDNSYVTGNQVCYQIEYKDVCGKSSARSNSICPIEMTATLEKDNSVILSWAPYNGWAIGVDHYEVERYNQDGALVQTFNSGLNTNFTDTEASADPEQIFTYRVLAIAADGIALPLPSISNEDEVVKNPKLTHPTAFVPNSQISANKTFRVFGNYINSYELRIFNRWGEMLFESLDKDRGWDGTYNGQQMPEGTYVFVARIIDFAGRTFEYGGTVVLLKKG